jgi:hypothetical protein
MLEIQALRKCITRDHLAMDPGAGCIGPGSPCLTIPFALVGTRSPSHYWIAKKEVDSPL